MVWAEMNITKLKRREQIISRARGIVSDYVEAQGKYKEVMGAPYNDILLATATQVARTYIKRHEEKASQQSTPMSGVSRMHLDVPNRWLGIFTPSSRRDPDISTVSTRIVPPPDALYISEGRNPLSEEPAPKILQSVGQAHLEVVEDETKGELPPLSTTTGGTRQPFHCPPPPDWWNRVNTQRARNDEIRDTGKTQIPDQGVVFDNHLPWDMWAKPSDLELEDVKREDGSKPPTPPPKDSPLGVMIQSPQTRAIYPIQRANRPDPLIISPPVDYIPIPAVNRQASSTSTRRTNPGQDPGIEALSPY